MVRKSKQGRNEVTGGQSGVEAEHMQEKCLDKSKGMTKRDVEKLVHELEARQVELEKQKEELRTAQEELKASQERNYDLYELAPVGYFSISEKGIVIEVNLIGANLLSVVPRDLRGRRFSSFIYKQDLDIYYLHRQQLFKSLLPQVCEMRMVRKDGSLFWARIEAAMAKDTRTGKSVCRAVMSDISRQKQADEALSYSERLLSGVFEKSPTAMWIADSSGTLIHLNQACRDLLNITDDDVVGKYSIFEDNIVEEQGFMPLVRGVFEKGTTAKFTLIYDSAQLKKLHLQRTVYRILEISVSAVRDASGEITNAVIQQVDITQRRQAEEALQARNYDLAIINNVANELALIHQGSDLYAYIVSTIKKLGNTATATFGKYNRQTEEIHIERVELDDNVIDDLRQVLDGKELLGKSFPVSDDVRHNLIQHPVRVQKALSDISFGVISPAVGDVVQKVQGIDRFVGVAYVVDGELYGTSVLGLRANQPSPSTEMLSSFANLVAVSLRRKQAEEALQDSEEKYRNIFNNSIEGIFQATPEGRYQTINPAFARMFGYASTEEMTESITNIGKQIYVFQEDRRRLMALLTAPGVTARDFEVQVRRKDGSPFWVSLNAHMVQSGKENARFIAGTCIDITERKQAEEALRKSEAQYRLLADNTADGVWLLDMDLKLLYCSPASAKQSGFTLQEILEMPLDQYFTPESLKVVTEAFLEIMPKIEADPDYNDILTLELEFYKKDGTAFWAECKFSIIRDENGKPISIIGQARDISERKQAEDALKVSEDKYRILFQSASEGISVVQDGRFKLVNPKLVELLGYTEDEILSMSVIKFIYPEDREFVIEQERRRLKGEEIESVYQFRAVNKSGDTRWVEISTVLIEWEGRPATLDYYSDITERRQAERRIKESEILYRSLIETSPDAIGLMDLNGTILMHNKQALEVFGFELTEDLTGTNIMDLVAPVNYKEILSNVEKLQKAETIRNWELTSCKKDGSPFYLELSSSMLFDEEGKPESIMTVFKDITERRLIEEKLEESYENLKKTIDDAIVAMSRMVEMKDPFTAGHQVRVALLATAIAREMKMPEEQVAYLNTAAIIHDIGKIYVPSDILSKPGKLNSIEFEIIKTHAGGAWEILKHIGFSGPVAQIARQHHERIDGSGYPQGLRGNEMLPEAKILAVADVVEAMASHRPYRPALGIDKALEQISMNRGTLFDPDTVDACLELFKSGRFEFKPD